MLQRVMSRLSISCRNFLSHSADMFRRLTLSCFTNFGYRKSLCFRGLRHDFRFPVEDFFVLQCRKFPWGESFSVSLISGIEKNWIRWGVVSRFCVEIILSHSAEKLRRGTFSCFTSFGYRKSLCFRGLCHDFRFPVEIFCLTVPTCFVG